MIYTMVPSSSASASPILAMTPFTEGSPIPFFAGGLDSEPAAFHLLIIHFFGSCFSIIVVLEFLHGVKLTMKAYGPLY